MKLHVVSYSFIALYLASSAYASCFDPSPAFPPPAYDKPGSELLDAFNKVEASLYSLISAPEHNVTSFSIQLTSAQSTLWSSYHTARDKNLTRPGAKEVQGDSGFRIASITKTFTTLALLQLHKAGKLALDDPVLNYVPELTGGLPWKDITIRILASQLSGIPRDWSQGDLLTGIPEPWRFGLPPTDRENTDLPDCYSYSDDYKKCNETDLYHAVRHLKPVFAPNFRSSYSNMAFEVLGLVISAVSGIQYEEYIQTHVLDLVNMTSSSFTPLPDSVAVLPKHNAWFWDVDEGIHNPTGGLYSTADDLSKYLRYILTHFNALATGVNWLQPHSFAFGSESFYGMPWEIFSTNRMLVGSERPVTFYTKSGGEPGYVSVIIAVPDYGLGFTILVAGGQEEIVGLIGELREAVTVPIMRAVEQMAKKQIEQKYIGNYTFEESVSGLKKLNTSLRLRYEEATGLVLEDFISNGTEVLRAFAAWQPGLRNPGTRAQLIPTLLYIDEEKQAGERWRMIIVPPKKDIRVRGVWDGFCITDVDILMYGGQPLNEVVMWTDNEGGVTEIELTAFRVKLKRSGEDRGLFLQEL